MFDKENQRIIKILYTNWKGKTCIRYILPIKLWYGSTKWHKQESWLLQAMDLEKNAKRDFVMKDILKWDA